MVFEVLSQKYKCGCGRGVNELIKKGILEKINELAEWDLIKFPRTKQHDVEYNGETVPVMVEDRKFLGEEPKLQPGNCILLGGQVIAFDGPDRIVLVVTETGGRSLERVYNEWIKPEWELTEELENQVEFDYEDYTGDLSEFDGSVSIPWAYCKTWKDLYLNGEDKKILVTLNTDTFPSQVVLGDWDCKYKTEDWEEEYLDVLQEQVLGVMSWFCRFYPRDNSWIDHEEETRKYIDAKMEEYECSLESSVEEP